jgi:hypothetical protein
MKWIPERRHRRRRRRRRRLVDHVAALHIGLKIGCKVDIRFLNKFRHETADSFVGGLGQKKCNYNFNTNLLGRRRQFFRPVSWQNLSKKLGYRKHIHTYKGYVTKLKNYR